ncbi:MAG: ribosomal protein L7/L12 [Opitutaceae bacterium]|nr:ribosomal protein L7/L12 [Opitutaceae bacterium]
MSQPLSSEKLAAIQSLIAKGQKIEAIKLHRELTGMGLKESKEAIEAMAEAPGGDTSTSLVVKPKGKGCLGAAAVLCLGGTAGLVWLLRR